MAAHEASAIRDAVWALKCANEEEAAAKHRVELAERISLSASRQMRQATERRLAAEMRLRELRE